MLLRINFRSGRPVYLQLVDQIKAAAVSGALRPSEALPSIGPLAEELRVNRNSVAKAYSELERLGVIEALPGKGHFLKEQHRPLRRGVQRRLLTAEIDQAIVQAPRAVEKTLMYSLLTFLLGALYLALVGGIGTLIVRAGLIRGESVAVLATVVVAAVFLPLRKRIRALSALGGELRPGIVHRLDRDTSGLMVVAKNDAAHQRLAHQFAQRQVKKTYVALVHGWMKSDEGKIAGGRTAACSTVHPWSSPRSQQ